VAIIGLALDSDGSAGAAARPATTVPKLRIPLSQPAPARQLLGTTASLWVNPDTPAARARTTALAQGRTADAAALARIAIRPTASWLTNSTSPATVQRVVASASAAARVPVFVIYYVPNRDCGSYSAGGASSASQYLSWVNSVVANLGNSRAIVVVEPDAVAMAASHSCAAAVADSRFALLSQAVTALKRAPNARVYLDAGHSGWVSNLSLLASTLNAAGLRSADGFALNVSNFRTTSDSIGYGTRLSALVGGKHFVIDTSRNGAGPLPAGSGYPGPSWCNPPGRALGTAPSLNTGVPLVDGYLWVKYPGESDGSCGLGDPAAGTFWLNYALGLAR
jgi:endoglucanase